METTQVRKALGPAASSRPGAPGTGILAGSGAARVADAAGAAFAIMVAWLAGLPRRAGRRLFAMNDQEARWHGWQVTELYGGLGRSYRDARFDAIDVLRRDDLGSGSAGLGEGPAEGRRVWGAGGPVPPALGAYPPEDGAPETAPEGGL